MSHRSKFIVTHVGLVLLMAVAGCNRDSESGQAPTTAINAADPVPPAGGDSKKPKAQADDKHPVVTIETQWGNITVELDREKTPNTVDNFLTYVNEGHYNQTIVHQVYKGQAILAGGYDRNAVERPTHPAIFNEARNGPKNGRGTIAMARLPDAIHSATSQFFINVADNSSLDHRDGGDEDYGYCVFGKVTDGMDIVDRIAAVKVHDTPAFDRTPEEVILIKSIRRVR